MRERVPNYGIILWTVLWMGFCGFPGQGAWAQSSPEKSKKTIALKRAENRPQTQRPIYKSDKPLIFAGRGFGIEGFSSQSQVPMYFDFFRHLEPPKLEILGKSPPDELDLEPGSIKHQRALIFHPGGLGLGQFPPEMKPIIKSPPKSSAPPLKKMADSRLHLSRGKSSSLVLQASGQSLDLLMGNEALNKAHFERWRSENR